MKFFKEQGRETLLLFDESGYLTVKEKWKDFHEKLLTYSKARKILFYAANTDAILQNFKKTIQLDDLAGTAKYFEMMPETFESVQKYVSDLLKGTDLFISPAAVKALYTISGGWPIAVNVLIFNFPQESKSIDLPEVKLALKRAREAQPFLVFHDLN